MSLYEADPGIVPVRITTFRQQRRAQRRGLPVEQESDAVVYADFFREMTLTTSRAQRP